MHRAESKTNFNRDWRIITAALFTKGMFIGYEESFIVNQTQLDIVSAGFYSFCMDQNGYVKSCMIVLAYVRTQPKIMNKRNVIELE